MAKREPIHDYDDEDDGEITPRELKELDEKLLINKHDLDNELVRQPKTLKKIADALALAISRRDAAKQALKELEAEFAIDYRDKARSAGDKFTEKEIEAETINDRDVKSANKALRDANFLVARLEGLKESYKDRGYVLGRLVELWLASYFESDAAVRKPQNKIRDDRAARAMEGLEGRRSNNQ